MCDTVWVRNFTALTGSFTPNPASFCAGNPAGVTVTATASGSIPYYTFIWRNSSLTTLQTTTDNTAPYQDSRNFTTTDAYTLEIRDRFYNPSRCPSVLLNIPVTTSSPPNMNAGPDDTLCLGAPAVLNGGSSTGYSSVQWAGGAGTFSNPTNILTSYTPAPSEIPGSVTLMLIGSNSGCLNDTDFVTLYYPSALSVTVNDIALNCHNDSTTLGSVIAGGTGPFTYAWSNGSTSSSIYTGEGTYCLTVTDSKGCTATDCANITAPSALTISMSSVDVTTNGGSDGSASTVVGGGTPGYTYNRTPGNPTGEGTANITNLSYGIYTVTVTDANNCSIWSSVVVNEPRCSGFSATATVLSNVNCFGSKTGSATATPSGGTGPYQYVWSNGMLGQTVTGLGAGTYQVTVIDLATGCAHIANINITQPPQLTTTTTQTNVTTIGGNNGSATVNPFGGTRGYTYDWTPGTPAGDGTPTITSLTAGSYSVTVTDANGCTALNNVLINQPPCNNLSLGVNSTNVSCFGGSNGTATAVVLFATPPVSYLWSTGATTSSISGLSAGNYSLTVTDAQNCPAIYNFTITQPSALSASIIATNISCHDSLDGTLELFVTGGTFPYTYSWNNGVSVQDQINLSPGTYNVTVTDANGCTANASGTITQPNPITATYNMQDISCYGGNNGFVDITVSGGNGGYTYLWSNGATTQDISNLTIGTYSVTVTDINGCTANSPFSYGINQPDSISATAVLTNLTCFSSANGSIDLTVSGGTTPYTYSWSNLATTQDITGVAAGTYTVTITDSLNCTKTKSYTLTQPTALTATAASQTNVLCNGNSTGAASVNVSGGTGAYSYNWTPGNPTGDGTNSVTGLAAGNYTCTITDANLCSTTVTFSITQPTALVASAASQTNVSCFAGNNGAASVNVSGGVTAYSYNWTPGNPTGDGTASVTGLTAGSWTCTVTDANGCSASQTFTITQPTQLVVTAASQTNVSCFNGTNGAASVSVSGGVTAYSYNWTPGNPTGDGTASVTGLIAGTYTCTVTDANNCTATQTFNITQPTLLVVSAASQTNVSCFGGSNGAASVSVTGGVTAYSYNWTPGNPAGDGTASVIGLVAGSYTCTVTDANNCVASQSFTITQPTAITATTSQTNVSCFSGNNGSATVNPSGGISPYTYSWSPSGGTNATATNLFAGTYTCTVTDANLCTFTSTFNITQPTAITASTSQTNVSCNGGNNGTATVTPSGGIPGYTYSWAPSGGTSATASNLTAGIYTCTITDANLCTITRTFNITEPTALTASTSQTNVSCFNGTNGSASVSVSGGTPGYTYSWAPSGGTSATASNLAAGNYTCTITDANSCVITRTFNITQPALLVVSAAAQTNVSCFNGANGAASVNVTGGVTTYSYNWTPGNPTGDGTASVTGLTAGTWVCTVTDANGCSASQSFTITQPNLLVVSAASQTNVLCNGGNNGAASVSVSGGTNTYTYDWTPGNPTGDGTNTVSGLTAGTWTCTVTDANGCTITQTVNITQPTQLVASVGSQTNVSCFAGSNGAATVNVTGGVTNYTYDWAPGAPAGDGTPTVTGLVAGTYTVTVTDANSCTTTQTFNITQPALLTANGVVTSNYNGYQISCYGNTDGAIDLTVAGGTSGYTFSWSNGGTTEDLSNIGAGQYIVTVTDALGCIAYDTVTVTQPDSIALTYTAQNVFCNGGSNGLIDLTVTGGAPGFTYAWSNGGNTQDITMLPIGTYSVTVTDTNGCFRDTFIVITEPAALTYNDSITHLTCFQSGDGAIDLTVNGGVTPYTYAWSNNATTEDLTGLQAGIYTVIVTDFNGCADTLTYTVAQPGALIATGAVTTNYNGYDVSCHGSNDGAIDLTVTGGTLPYVYSWSTAAQSEDISNLTAGTYTVTVLDAHLCFTTATVVLTEPAALNFTATHVDVPCNGFFTGSIDVTMNGGVAPYTYLWSNNETTEDIDTLGAGFYSVHVTDTNGCTLDTTIEITQSSPIAATASTGNILCHGDETGSIDLTVSGATPPYNYAWSNGDTLQDLGGLVAGIYTVIVTDSNGCVYNDTFVVAQPADSLTGSISAYVYPNGYNTSLSGASDGSIDLNVEGGTYPYSYIWSTGATTQDIAGLPGGQYSVIVTDTNGCNIALQITLTEPRVLEMPTGYSPNNDGQNDYFVIHGIESYPDNKLEIFNRWGNLVFDAKNYNNTWRGTSNTGEELPDGTYFVILTINNGEIVLTGYVDIRR